MKTDEFRDAWSKLTPAQREWVKAKANWERMSCFSVMREWAVPADSKLNSDGTVHS